MIRIDGAEKSGSGTIVRLAAALCTILGQELHLWNIRAKRDKPGLRPQHLQVVLACAQMCHGKVEKAEVGSHEIIYRPGKQLMGGVYEWDIGTAGSTTMLAMSLALVGCFADKPSTFRISGSLFQDFAPSAYHMQQVLFPLLRRMGAGAELEVKKPGYVPEGKGVIEVKVNPAEGRLRPLALPQQGNVTGIKGIALSSHLAEQRVSQRMAEECRNRLREDSYHADIESRHDTQADQKGAVLSVWAETDSGCLIGSDRAGRRGRSSEEIGRYVARNLLQDLKTGAAVDRYAADQLIPYCAVASGTSEYVIPAVTEHVETNLWLVHRILGSSTSLENNRVRIQGADCQQSLR